jgi:hypothetical protein
MNRLLLKLMIGSLFLLSLSLGSCIEFKKMGLYDQPMAEDKVIPPPRISMAVEPIIFKDDTFSVWGIEKDSCKDLRYSTDVTAAGDGALELKWNRAGCIWAGFGIGWDGWAGKDLSEIREVAAIEMKVRTAEGKMFGLPFVLTLEDYTDAQSYAYTANKYFERSAIDEDWQTVTVPLTAFDFEKDGIDPTNVKQLMFEFQGSGHVFLDEIKVIDYVAPPEEESIWEVEIPTAAYSRMPQTLYDDDFINDNGWGILNYACHQIKMTAAQPYRGEQAISAKWNYQDNDHCDSRSMGVNWSYWQPMDLREVKDDMVISFALKAVAGKDKKELPVEVGLMGFDGSGWVSVPLSTQWVEGDAFTGQWQEVMIPVKELKGKVDWTRIKDLEFHFAEKGEIVLDEIQLQTR